MNLDHQRRKRPGNRARIEQIRGEMDQKVCDEPYQPDTQQHIPLRDRIAASISGVDDWRGVTEPAILADAVIEALGLTRFDAPPEYWYATTILATYD